MTFKKKILIGYGVSFVLMGLVIGWAVTNLVSLGKATDAILSENYRSIIAAEKMVDALERQDSAILLMLLGGTKKGVAQFHENEAVFFEWFARAKDNITIDGEAKIIQSIENDYVLYRRQFSDMTDLRASSRPALNLSLYGETVNPIFVKVREVCIGLRNLNEETMYTASVKAGKVARRAIWSTTIVAASALIVALIFSLFLVERIVQPIRHFMEASRKISSGDYAVRIPVETGDELGELAGEFNRMATELGRYHEMNIEHIITEKNKSEAILSSIEDGLVVFDVTLKVISLNPAARRMLDLGFAENELLDCADIFPDANVCHLIRKVVETGEAGEQATLPAEERIIRFADRHYLFSITDIRGRDRNLTGIVLLLKDVTRLKEVEQLKSEFVMAASHELRTPLTSLGMSIDLLLEKAVPELNETNQELLKAAHEEVYRMKALVNDLLDLSKIEAGKIDLLFEMVPVRTLFEHAGSVFKNQLDMKGITLTSDVAENLPEVRADANKITWVLTNLISNALRYVSKGGHIDLIARRVGAHIHLIVRDDGPGIPVEYQSKIFEKFVQVKGREPGGSGLGLSICKEIVRAHGGAIWVDSVADQGSIFTFSLPVS